MGAPETSLFILLILRFCAVLEPRLRPKSPMIYIIHSLDLCYIWMHWSPRNQIFILFIHGFWLIYGAPAAAKKLIIYIIYSRDLHPFLGMHFGPKTQY